MRTWWRSWGVCSLSAPLSLLIFSSKYENLLAQLGSMLPICATFITDFLDTTLKKALCFAETLVVSCTHYEGDDGYDNASDRSDEASERSELICSSSTSNTSSTILDEATESIRYPPPPEPIVEEEMEEEDNPFAFYFFPDCNKPLPKEYSKQSIIRGPDEWPMFNPNSQFPEWCKCDRTKKGVCECFVKLPCECGAKKQAECTCGKAKKICVCDERNPAPKCLCHKNERICTCWPGLPRPYCTCLQDVKRPCVCDKDKYPFPICQCKSKPWRISSFNFEKKKKKSSVASRLPLSFIGDNEKEKDLEEIPEDLMTVASTFVEGEAEEDEAIAVYVAKDDSEQLGLIKSGTSRETRQASEIIETKQDSVIRETKQESEIISQSSKYGYEEEVEEEIIPCPCQDPDPKDICRCRTGEKCICNAKIKCSCGLQNICTCYSKDSINASQRLPCKEYSCTQSICDCRIPKVCTCGKKEDDCVCFPKYQDCICGDPENCTCQKICECTEPCICDIQKKPEECLCLDKEGQIREGNVVCTCPRHRVPALKLKKIRKGKHGWTFCPEVDPYHTYFDYAYDRHHLIDQKEQEKEKFKILGLHDDEDNVCPAHRRTLPSFRKRVWKPSLDCCSSVGGITISVQPLGSEEDKFLVNVISHASKEGAKTGSKLVSIVDLNLHTLEENRIESITKKDFTKERRSYMAICDVGYYNKVTKICGDRDAVKRLYHNFEDAKDFLLEGANVILMRYFGLSRYKGSITTHTVLMDGMICESIYVCLGVSQAIVNGKPLFVEKVERHILEPNGFVHQTLTVLSLRGYMISHEWHDNNYILHLNPLLRVIPEEDRIEDHAPLREKWREDMQLFSDFLDHKANRSGEGSRYIEESGVLTNTVRDYLQAILLLKPPDVLHFTRHYFDSMLSAMDLPREGYFDVCPKHVRYFYMENLDD